MGDCWSYNMEVILYEDILTIMQQVQTLCVMKIVYPIVCKGNVLVYSDMYIALCFLVFVELIN